MNIANHIWLCCSLLNLQAHYQYLNFFPGSSCPSSTKYLGCKITNIFVILLYYIMWIIAWDMCSCVAKVLVDPCNPTFYLISSLQTFSLLSYCVFCLGGWWILVIFSFAEPLVFCMLWLWILHSFYNFMANIPSFATSGSSICYYLLSISGYLSSHPFVVYLAGKHLAFPFSCPLEICISLLSHAHT